jgi:hypothetical protein
MITTEELNILKSRTTEYFAQLGKNNFNNLRFGTELCTEKFTILKEVLMYQWVLSTWQQYLDGTIKPDVNYISQSDFDLIVTRLNFIIDGI